MQFEKLLGIDRFTICTHILSADNFVNTLYDVFDTLNPHAYSAEAQTDQYIIIFFMLASFSNVPITSQINPFVKQSLKKLLGQIISFIEVVGINQNNITFSN